MNIAGEGRQREVIWEMSAYREGLALKRCIMLLVATLGMGLLSQPVGASIILTGIEASYLAVTFHHYPILSGDFQLGYVTITETPYSVATVYGYDQGSNISGSETFNNANPSDTHFQVYLQSSLYSYDITNVPNYVEGGVFKGGTFSLWTPNPPPPAPSPFLLLTGSVDTIVANLDMINPQGGTGTGVGSGTVTGGYFANPGGWSWKNYSWESWNGVTSYLYGSLSNIVRTEQPSSLEVSGLDAPPPDYTSIFTSDFTADCTLTFAPVPEPGTLLLLATGLTGLVPFLRSRRT